MWDIIFDFEYDILHLKNIEISVEIEKEVNELYGKISSKIQKV